MNGGADAQRYSLAAGVRMVALDDEIVVFNPVSWETHLLNCAAAIAVELAAVGGVSVASLQAELEQALDSAERGRAGAYAAGLIQELRGLQLLGD